MNEQKVPAVAGRVEQPVRPRAWMRRWYFEGETPYKERNKNGRPAWPQKFKFLAVTPNKVLDDDVPLYAIDHAA